MYYDHEFEGDQNQPCQALVMKYNDKFDHDYDHEDEYCTNCESHVRYEDYGNGGGRSFCKCEHFTSDDWVHETCRKDRDDILHNRRIALPCNREWTSAVHPPDQFRHWCSILEAGGDCMHMEDY